MSKISRGAALTLLASAIALQAAAPARAGETIKLAGVAPSLSLSAPWTQAPDDPDSPPGLSKEQTPAPAPAEETPVYKKWWFWAATAAVVGGTIVLAAVAIDPTTPPAKGCTMGTALCFGEGRPR